jgi:uncharacterized phiE125 gp8 family phage protein
MLMLMKFNLVAGYGNTASDVPKPLVQAIKMLALHLYENREIATSIKC